MAGRKNNARPHLPIRFAITAIIVIAFALVSLAAVAYRILYLPQTGGWSLLGNAVLALMSAIMIGLGYAILENSRWTGRLALAFAIIIIVYTLVGLKMQAITPITELQDIATVLLSLFIVFYILRNSVKMRIR
jgi:hypothetical protein